MAISLNGSTQYVDLGSGVNIYQTRPWTFATVFNRTVDGFSTLFQQGDGSTTGYELYFDNASGGNALNLVYCQGGTAFNPVFTFTASITSGWNFVAIVFRTSGTSTIANCYSYNFSSGSNSSLSLNSQTMAANGDPTAPTTGNACRIGGSSVNDDFGGQIGWTGIFAGDLGNAGSAQPAAIRELLVRGPWGMIDSNCKLFIPFAGAAQDLSSNGRNGTLVASPSYVAGVHPGEFAPSLPYTIFFPSGTTVVTLSGATYPGENTALAGTPAATQALSGATAASSETALAGTSGLTSLLNGSTAASSETELAGTPGLTSLLNGATAGSSETELAGSVAQTALLNGATAGSSETALAGSVAQTQTVPGVTAPSAEAEISQTPALSQTVPGATAPSSETALAGQVSQANTLVGATAPSQETGNVQSFAFVTGSSGVTAASSETAIATITGISSTVGASGVTAASSETAIASQISPAQSISGATAASSETALAGTPGQTGLLNGATAASSETAIASQNVSQSISGAGVTASSGETSGALAGMSQSLGAITLAGTAPSQEVAQPQQAAQTLQSAEAGTAPSQEVAQPQQLAQTSALSVVTAANESSPTALSSSLVQQINSATAPSSEVQTAGQISSTITFIYTIYGACFGTSESATAGVVSQSAGASLVTAPSAETALAGQPVQTSPITIFMATAVSQEQELPLSGQNFSQNVAGATGVEAGGITIAFPVSPTASQNVAGATSAEIAANGTLQPSVIYTIAASAFAGLETNGPAIASVAYVFPLVGAQPGESGPTGAAQPAIGSPMMIYGVTAPSSETALPGVVSAATNPGAAAWFFQQYLYYKRSRFK